MQGHSIATERRALRELPGLLADLLDRPVEQLRAVESEMRGGREVDARITDPAGTDWLFEFKSSSRPAVVAAAAEQLRALAELAPDAIAALVVPYMTEAGADAAAARRVNWLDLSGNAEIRDESLYISVRGRPNAFPRRGRPSSAFAPKSSRVARALLDDPTRWWRQKDLPPVTGLDDGRISRIVRRLDDDQLLARRDDEFRPADPDLLLDAWAEVYAFDRHDAIVGHASGSGIELARDLSERLDELGIEHAATGLPAAWQIDAFARFRLVSLYVVGNPHLAADRLGLRLNERGANVQLLAPDDEAVMAGVRDIGGLPTVSPVQTYLDLRHLPERAAEAADHLRAHGLLWSSS